MLCLVLFESNSLPTCACKFGSPLKLGFYLMCVNYHTKGRKAKCFIKG